MKRARYAAEFGAPSREKLNYRPTQGTSDALGVGTTGNKLSNTAVERFGEVNQSSLVAALQNVVRGKFRQAVAICFRARHQAIFQKQPRVHIRLPKGNLRRNFQPLRKTIHHRWHRGLTEDSSFPRGSLFLCGSPS